MTDIKNTCYSIFGSGSMGKEIKEISQLSSFLKNKKITIIDDKKFVSKKTNIIDYKIFIKKYKNSKKKVFIAIQDPLTREKIYNELKKYFKFFSVVPDDLKVLSNSEYKNGSSFMPGNFISYKTKIGKQFQSGIYTTIGHNCLIGNFVTFGANVSCSGNVKIGNKVFVGSGSVIKNGTSKKKLKIGNNVIIGMGSVVIKDVPSNSVVFGNPARVIKKNKF